MSLKYMLSCYVEENTSQVEGNVFASSKQTDNTIIRFIQVSVHKSRVR